jgi:hypothetical protein
MAKVEQFDAGVACSNPNIPDVASTNNLPVPLVATATWSAPGEYRPVFGSEASKITDGVEALPLGTVRPFLTKKLTSVIEVHFPSKHALSLHLLVVG